MTLDEYRTTLISKIKKAPSGEDAVHEVATAQAVLNDAKISLDSQKKFWTYLYQDLEAVTEEVKPSTLIHGNTYEALMEKAAATSLSAIIATAQEVIANKVK